MPGLDWSFYGVVGLMLTAIRVVWSAAKAWAREPIKDAKIRELTHMVEMMKENQDRLEQAHVRERSRWEWGNALSSGPLPSQLPSTVTRTSDEPEA